MKPQVTFYRTAIIALFLFCIGNSANMWGQYQKLTWNIGEKFEWSIEHVELTEEQIRSVIAGTFNADFPDFMGESSQAADVFGGDRYDITDPTSEYKGRNPAPGVFRLEVKLKLPTGLKYATTGIDIGDPFPGRGATVSLSSGQWDFTLWSYDGETWNRQVPTNKYLDADLDLTLKGARHLPHGNAAQALSYGSPGYYFSQYAMSGKVGMNAQGGQTARPYQEVSPCNGGTFSGGGGALLKGGVDNVLFYYPLYIQPGGLTGGVYLDFYSCSQSSYGGGFTPEGYLNVSGNNAPGMKSHEFSIQVNGSFATNGMDVNPQTNFAMVEGWQCAPGLKGFPEEVGAAGSLGQLRVMESAYNRWVMGGITVKEAPQPVQVTVNFNTQGGNEIESQTIYDNEKITEPANPVREAYVFEGWYTEEEGLKAWNFDNVIGTADITLYAKWSLNQEEAEDLIARLRAENEGLKEDTANLFAAIGGLKEDTTALNAQITNYELRITNLRNDTTALNAEIADLEEDIVNYQLSIVNLKNDTADLNAEIADLEEDIVNYQLSIVNLKNDTARLNAEIAELATGNDLILIEENQALKEDTAMLNEKITNYELQITNLRTDTTALNAEIADLEEDIVNYQLSIVNLKSDTADLNAEIADLEEDIVNYQLSIVHLQSDTADLNARIAQMQAEAGSWPEEKKQLLRDTVRLHNLVLNAQESAAYYTKIAQILQREKGELNDLIAILNLDSEVLHDSIMQLVQMLENCENGGTANANIIPQEHIQIHPNPVNYELRITNYEWKEGDVVELFDLNGNRVYSAKPNCQLSIVNCPLIIDVSHLPNGTYILRIGNRVAKVVKQ